MATYSKGIDNGTLVNNSYNSSNNVGYYSYNDVINTEMFNVGMHKNDPKRGLPEDIKKANKFRSDSADPSWKEATDPYYAFSQPLPRFFKNQVPYPSDEWYRQRPYISQAIPEQEMETHQVNEPVFVIGDDSWYTPKIFRRAYRFAYDDRQYSKERGGAAFMNETWANAELQADLEDADAWAPEREFVKPKCFQLKKNNCFLRYTNSETDLTKCGETLKNQSEMAEHYNFDGEFAYGPSEENRATIKYVNSASHFFQDNALHYKNKPEEDLEGDYKRCLDPLPPDGDGTICIVREYYEDDHRRVRPIIRALNQATKDNYQLIVVEPLSLNVPIGTMIIYADRLQIVLAIIGSCAITTLTCYPDLTNLWNLEGWSAMGLFLYHNLTWEKEGLANYEYWAYMEDENHVRSWSQKCKDVLENRRIRAYHLNRIPIGTLLNRTGLLIVRREFPFNRRFKNFFFRSQFLSIFGLMVYRSGWHEPMCRLNPTRAPFFDEGGNFDYARWGTVPSGSGIWFRRILAKSSFSTRFTLLVYDVIVNMLTTGTFFGMAAVSLVWYNWVRRERPSPEDYRKYRVSTWEAPYFDFENTVDSQRKW